MAKKITIPAMHGGLGAKECIDIFGEDKPGMELMQKYSVQEVLARLEAYEKTKAAEVKVGYIVHVRTLNVDLIVTRIDKENQGIYGLNKAGMLQWADMNNITKTDRFTEIQGLLDDLD